jgi:DNA-binding transcriptional LysR family regulator
VPLPAQLRQGCAVHALLAERHVTRAAKRCFLSQPAMSRALDRLRQMFGDLLLVRSGRAYERTVRGDACCASWNR